MAAVTSCENALLSSWKTQAWEFLGCIDTIPDSSYGDRKKIPGRVSVQQHIRTMILSRFLQRREPAAEPPRRSWKWIVTNRIGFCHCSSQCEQVRILSVVFVWAKRECERELLLRTCTPNSICLIVDFSSYRKWERDAWFFKYCTEREYFQWSNFKSQIQTRHSLERLPDIPEGNI